MFLYHGTSGFGDEEVLTGRPYGGCAILWRSDLNFRVDVIATGSRRCCAVRICTDTWSMLVINVYMPYEDGSERSDLFVQTLSVIESVIAVHADCHVIVGGDFNVDFSRAWLHTGILRDFCAKLNLEPTILHESSHVDYTYNFNMSRFNLLDHFIVSGTLFHTAVELVSVMHDGDNISDHEPLCIELNLCSEVIGCSKKSHTDRIAWHKVNDT